MNNIQNSDKRILFIASENIGKIKEFTQLFPKDIFDIISQPKTIKINETGRTFSENARLKATEVANFTNQWAFADDSGLSVNALNGAPGIYSARYARNDDERIARLLKELSLVQDRRAIFTSALCLAAPAGKVLIQVEGICKGLITKEKKGKMGFGYDPIFQVLGTSLTYAEMNPVQKQKLSHRGVAFSLFLQKLDVLLSSNQFMS